MAIDKDKFMQIGHLFQLGLCLYGGWFSYLAIINVRKYEAITEKAAKYSKEVERQLWLTRKTQAAGVLCLLLSFITASTVVVFPNYFSGWLKWVPSPAVLIATVAGQQYIRDYWAPYTDANGNPIGQRIPLPNMGDYNKAEKMTERLLVVLQILEYSWAFSAFFTALGMGV